jgi:retron-type reverse transcriptase
VQQAALYVRTGLDIVVDIDLEKFFDRVNHDMLMARVARVVKDKRVLKLIRLSGKRRDGEWGLDGDRRRHSAGWAAVAVAVQHHVD